MYVVHQRNCGGKPTVSNDSATLSWITESGFGSSVVGAELNLKKVDNAWSQSGCLNIEEVLSGSVSVAKSGNYTISPSSVDYDSLYIARLQWIDSAGNKFLVKDGDCYFTLQPSELVFVCTCRILIHLLHDHEYCINRQRV